MRSHAVRSSCFAGLLLLATSIPAFGASILTTTNPLVELETSRQEGRLVELTIESEPSGAQVTLNGRPRGVTPVELSNLPPGIVLLEIAAEGFETTQVRLRLAGNEAVLLSVPLQRQTGTLGVVVDPPDAEVLLDGEPVAPSKVAVVPTGSYRLVLRRFGYRSEAQVVEILPNVTVALEAVLEPAPFTVDVSLQGRRLALLASAPGQAEVSLKDSTGAPVVRNEVSLTAEETVVNLEDLPPGDYRVRLRARGGEQNSLVLLSRTISLGPRMGTKPTGLAPWSLSQGLLFAPAVGAVDDSGFAIGSGWTYLPDTPGTGMPSSIFSLASTVALARETELLIGSTLFLSEDPELNRLSFTSSALWRFYSPGSLTLGLQGRVSGDVALGEEKDYRPDLTGTPPGIFLGIPTSWNVQIGSTVLSSSVVPEAGFTWSPPSWNQESQGPALEAGGILGLRGGVALGVGPLLLAASGRLGWTLPKAPDAGTPSTQFGLEARFSIPEWATTIAPLFAFAGPWGEKESMIGVSVTVGR